MRHSNKTPVVIFFVILFSAFLPTSSLLGKWTIPGVNEYVNFKSDGSYEVYLPGGKVGENGFYSLNDTVFKIMNAKPICGDGYWGTYSLRFVGEDSIHFTLIEDSCLPRRMDIVGYNPGLRRMK